MTEDDTDEYARFESLAREIVNTPKPQSESADALGEPADEDAERENG